MIKTAKDLTDNPVLIFRALFEKGNKMKPERVKQTEAEIRKAIESLNDDTGFEVFSVFIDNDIDLKTGKREMRVAVTVRCSSDV